MIVPMRLPPLWGLRWLAQVGVANFFLDEDAVGYRPSKVSTALGD